MKNIKSYSEYIHENVDSTSISTPEENLYKDPADLGDGRKEIDTEEASNQTSAVRLGAGRPNEVKEMKNDVNLEEVEYRAKVDIDRFHAFANKPNDVNPKTIEN